MIMLTNPVCIIAPDRPRRATDRRPRAGRAPYPVTERAAESAADRHSSPASMSDQQVANIAPSGEITKQQSSQSESSQSYAIPGGEAHEQSRDASRLMEANIPGGQMKQQTQEHQFAKQAEAVQETPGGVQRTSEAAAAQQQGMIQAPVPTELQMQNLATQQNNQRTQLAHQQQQLAQQQQLPDLADSDMTAVSRKTTQHSHKKVTQTSQKVHVGHPAAASSNSS
ncbi:hypothetical protein FJT64_012821 [Amphibalanus amphitrite]|uniref:Uncharacterized protein n=1 Tax=Amphibalanus amphitrite TaxID=1232801 RepID=A0A6A4V4X9_AMPAM|nr:hypothetical protein FJT64_012821 [Amphibalanus amphitrite]